MYGIMTRRVRLQLCPSHLAAPSDGSGREPKVCACLEEIFEKKGENVRYDIPNASSSSLPPFPIPNVP